MSKSSTQNGATPWESGRFSVPPSRHALLAMEAFGARWWWTAAIPVAALAVMGIIADWRYGVVAAMLVFTVLPMALMAGWLKALGSRGALCSVYDMEASVSADGSMTLRFFRPPAPRTGAEPDTSQPEPEPKTPAPLVLPRSDLRHIRLWRGLILLEYDGINVMIPLSDNLRPSVPALLKLTGMWESHIF